MLAAKFCLWKFVQSLRVFFVKYAVGRPRDDLQLRITNFANNGDLTVYKFKINI
jgi:hypothetical protein